ncbi:hypothetical protein [Desulfosporosinus nitroreducens]|uniref:hypothetical protein n=1 Tax=Desulfosporosinus nitroreducens TaxID=2018668 RepID=UPI00207CDECE|nr:hypothetical protein [Desulfosporosinus nitroreducens]MCO1604688.1 hypothetical protein [Desulfosporosinus nitroreducens]
MAGYWKYKVRNKHFRDFLPKFFTTLDYLAFMIFELSRGSLIPEQSNKEPRRIDFNKIKKSLIICKGDQNDIGWLSLKDREKIENSLNKIFRGISSDGQEILKRYRDIITHRYLPGIDEITINTERQGSRTRAVPDRGKLYAIGDGRVTYDNYAIPEFKFTDLIMVARSLIYNLSDIINEIASLEIMKTVIRTD